MVQSYLSNLLLQSIWFAMPIIWANQAPVLFKYFKVFTFLDKPIDFNKKFIDGKPIFGKNKTYRGFLSSIIVGILVVELQYFLFLKSEVFRVYSIIDYSSVSFVLLGFLFGFGVMFGDLIESFLKRRFNRQPGKPWIPWDQIDLVIGGLLFVSFVFIPPLDVIVTLLIGAIPVHLAINLLGYKLKIKKNKL